MLIKHFIKDCLGEFLFALINDLNPGAFYFWIPVSVDIELEFNSLWIPFLEGLRVHLADLACQCDLLSIIVLQPQVNAFGL